MDYEEHNEAVTQLGQLHPHQAILDNREPVNELVCLQALLDIVPKKGKKRKEKQLTLTQLL